jgi:cellulose synthase/poly-beta-1,6-N-acetylglucosamine synthase-like glycosyltransferase
MIAALVFWLSVLALFHSYVLYPLLLQWLIRIRKPVLPVPSIPGEQPMLSVIISAFNEEGIIGKKIETVLASDFPAEKIELLIGSDASTDATNSIIRQMADKDPRIRVHCFTTRRGKGPVLNDLVQHAQGNILVLTDANVLFSRDTLTELMKYFCFSETGLVDSNMKHSGIRQDGISPQESAYITREVMIKHREGLLWGAMMGPFGGCFALRRELFSPIPENYLVDDFYLNMHVLKQGYKAMSRLESVVYEDVSNSLQAELRRKTRIATGNFQNLFHFAALLWPPYKGRAFAFLSHKALRWFGPFFLLAALVSAFILAGESVFFRFAAWGQVLLLVLVPADFLLRKINLHIIFLRFLTHFYTMNLAMFTGFIRYLKGVKSNVWQPTQRNLSS